MIMHRHPQRDNMLHTITTQIMALHVHTKAEQRPCLAVSLSACYHTRRPTHTQNVRSLRFCSVSCLSQGPSSSAKAPTTPPLHHDSAAPFVCLSGIQLLVEGAWARDKTDFTTLDGGPNTVLHIHTYTLYFCAHTQIWMAAYKISCSQSNTGLLMGPCIVWQIIQQHTLQERAHKKHLVLYVAIMKF